MKVSRWIVRILVAVAILVLMGAAGFVLYFSNPYPPSPTALAALQSAETVTVTDTRAQITFMPQKTPAAGFIFYPGANVEPAAYAARLRPLAEHGYAVFIVKFPLNLAIFGVNCAGEIIAAHPGIQKWVVGGHSLGGAFASTFIENRTDVAGLVLYGAYPAGSLAGRTDLVVVSIYGTQDGLATVADIEASRPNLPPQTRYVAIEGGIHSFFGDYGLQDGDGKPAISREDAAGQITAATIEAMDAVAKQ